MSVAGVSTDSIDKYVTSERLRVADEMTAFLDANAMADHGRSLIIEEGAPFEVISSTVQRSRPDILVLGNSWPFGNRQSAFGERDRRGFAIARHRYPRRPATPIMHFGVGHRRARLRADYRVSLWGPAFEETSGRGTPSMFSDLSRNSAARTRTMSVIGVVISVKTAMRTSCSTGRDCWTEK